MLQLQESDFVLLGDGQVADLEYLRVGSEGGKVCHCADLLNFLLELTKVLTRQGDFGLDGHAKRILEYGVVLDAVVKMGTGRHPC